jgi:hypothetical protein
MYDDGSSYTLLRQLPRIRRARDYRLYTHDGRRFVDLWQYGGRAVLGHTIPHQLQELKNSASRGLFAPFPNHLEGQLEKTCARLFPGRIVRIYQDSESMRRAFEKADFASPAERFLPDPALRQHSAQSSIVLWRPFLDDAEHQSSEADILFPILPFPWMNAPRILLLEKAVSKLFPPSDLLPLVISSVLLASLNALAKQIALEMPDFSQLTKNLSETSWQRRGIYLMNPYFKDDAQYEKIFQRFLDKGFLIPPKRNLPLILPIQKDYLSQGEIAKLSSLLREACN